MKSFIIIVIVVMVALFAPVAYLIYQEIRWSRQPSFECEAILLTHDFFPSTLQTHVAPVISTKGQAGTVVYTSGSREKNLTVWDCGKYGRITCIDKQVFRFAKPKANLILKELDGDCRIIGIKHE